MELGQQIDLKGKVLQAGRANLGQPWSLLAEDRTPCIGEVKDIGV
jgi:hypothetical protein